MVYTLIKEHINKQIEDALPKLAIKYRFLHAVLDLHNIYCVLGHYAHCIRCKNCIPIGIFYGLTQINNMLQLLCSSLDFYK